LNKEDIDYFVGVAVIRLGWRLRRDKQGWLGIGFDWGEWAKWVRKKTRKIGFDWV